MLPNLDKRKVHVYIIIVRKFCSDYIIIMQEAESTEIETEAETEGETRTEPKVKVCMYLNTSEVQY